MCLQGEEQGMKERERERGCMFADEESERVNGLMDCRGASRSETKIAAKRGGRWRQLSWEKDAHRRGREKERDRVTAKERGTDAMRE